jgi:predicted ATPase/class 3 adenylate cyclase
MLSRIVLRLIEKNPEERYQSARGLLRDLEECQARWKDAGRIEPFDLGREDTEAELRVSQRLVGRDVELTRLLAAFEAVARGASRTVMVSGEAGIGKSALVNEIRRPIFRLNGYFIEGKFDQFQRHAPYAAFAQAFRQLIVQLLAEPGDRLARWASELRDTLGPNGQLVVELVPEIERVIGPQRPIPPGNPVEEQNRFQTTIAALVRTFARDDHPLVLFLDDLQWSDEPTLALLTTLLADRDIGSLLFIGSFRASEVDGAHPLRAFLTELERRQPIERLELGPLPPSAVNQLVAGALHAPEDRVGRLAQLLGGRTRGNPLFLSEVLEILNRAGALAFDAEHAEWTWDLARVEDAVRTSDVVDLMLFRLKALLAKTRSWLSLASCIGTSFDLRTLSIAGESPPGEVAQGLWEAVREGLVVPMNEDYRLVHGEAEEGALATVPSEAPAFDVRYRFQHDRVQQAAYALIPEGERAALHLRIGRLLLQGSTAGEREERLIEIVHQLNEGTALLASDAERSELAALNLAAARKAMRSAAYGPAFELLQIGSRILPADVWDAHFVLAYEMHHLHAACAYLVGQYPLAEELSAQLLRRARTPLDKARVYAMQLVQLTFCDRMDEAVEAGLRGLRLLGVRMSARPSMAIILKDLLVAKRLLGRRRIADLANAAVVSDPAVCLCLRILIDFIPPAYLTGNDKLFAAAVLKQAGLSLKHGSGPEAAAAYASYVVLLAGLGDLRGAYQFGQLALKLTEQFGSESKCRNQVLYTLFGHSWSHPWREMRPRFEEAVRTGLETGDLLFTAYACGWIHLWDPEVDVLTAWEEGRKYLAVIENADYQNAHDAASLPQQLWANLLGKTADRLSLSSADFDEEACRARMERVRNVSGLGIRAVCRTALCLYYEEYEQGLDIIEESAPIVRALAGSPYLVEYHLFAFLICASLTTGRRGRTASRQMRRLRRNMGKWATHCPENFRQHQVLMDAEWAGLRGDVGAAARLYVEAIALAREGGFARYEALANERAARFFAAQGLEQVAALHLTEARHQYARWGATEKLRFLEERHRLLLSPEPAKPVEPATAAAAEGDHWVDVETVWSAAQTLSEEVILEKMLERLMVILRENAGATRGALILREHDSHQLLVQAETRESGAVTVLQHGRLEDSDLPVNIVRYVERSGQPVVVADAAAQRDLMNDPYLRRCRARSLLAMPILHRGQPMGVLYLENRLATHVFTPKRLSTLRMLSSQAAISLQNARLYEHVQRMADSFSRFVPREFLRSLGRSQFLDIQLGESVQKTMTVLFSDIRGFTALVERMSPTENVNFVNAYISYMEPAILENGGFVDSYIGDAIMALFDRPAAFAVRAAVAMLRALEEFNLDRARAGEGRVAVGIGLNTGLLTLGTIGGTERLKCGVIGDTVNVAARIESLTKRYSLPLLISGQTLADLPAELCATTRFVDRVRVAGHAEALDLYEVFDADPAPLREAKQLTSDRWRQSMELFYARQFDEASAAFAGLQPLLPDDPVAALFTARAERLAAAPPDDGWTGIEAFSEK